MLVLVTTQVVLLSVLNDQDFPREHSLDLHRHLIHNTLRFHSIRITKATCTITIAQSPSLMATSTQVFHHFLQRGATLQTPLQQHAKAAATTRSGM